MNCSLPGCEADATVCWQRAATTDEHAEFYEQLQAQIDGNAEERRQGVQAIIDHLEWFNAQQKIDDPNGRRIVGYNNRRIERLRRDIEAVPQPTLDPHSYPPSTMPVYACQEHAPAADLLTQLHEVGCFATGSGCTCAPALAQGA